MRQAMVTGLVVFAALFFQAVEAVPPAVDTYRPFDDKDGVKIEMSQRSDIPWIKATFDVAASADKVITLLSNFATFGDTFSNIYASAEVLSKGSEVGVPFARMHLIWKTPFPFSKRDAVALYKLQFNSDGTRMVMWQGDAKAGDPAEGVRVEHVEGMTQVVPTGANSCRIIYTYLADAGGAPNFLANRSRHTHPLDYRKAILDSLGL